MRFTAQEKQLGRRFRDQAQAELSATFDASPPTYTVPNFLAVYRHSCARRNMRSTALELHEVYRPSPADECGDIPAGRFGFIYREGICQLCGQTARSRVGRLVDRPPISSRVARIPTVPDVSGTGVRKP